MIEFGWMLKCGRFPARPVSSSKNSYSMKDLFSSAMKPISSMSRWQIVTEYRNDVQSQREGPLRSDFFETASLEADPITDMRNEMAKVVCRLALTRSNVNEDAEIQFFMLPRKLLQSRSIVLFNSSRAFERSCICCRLSQNSGLFPKKRASRSAVSGVIGPSAMNNVAGRRVAGTRIFNASAFCVMPRGIRNSSRSISPGCVLTAEVPSGSWSIDCHSPVLSVPSVIIHDLHVMRSICLPEKQMRHRSLIWMLCCPARSRFQSF